ncbi:hypothetical protein BDN72DRAFT_966207 [Pluteus cervinus]|uniref:Uncharacterized protein n=1 Tax=Pluteus cervinus TaxID=181527 RepID=A0ACD2ZZN6_9AGAR|nr:hypothetical protein BDN72DRAFT_966207 [Pluteus cervinus]
MDATSDIIHGTLPTEHAQACIQVLPSELLHEIFPLCVTPKVERFLPPTHIPPRFNTTALAISHTCAAWRTLAISLPHMWSTITVCCPDVRITQLVKLYLQRSGDTIPLDLSLTESNHRYMNGGENLSELWYKSSMRILYWWRNQVHRWRSIELHLDRLFPWKQFMEITPDQISQVETAILALPLWANDEVDWFWDLLHKSPKLCETRWFCLPTFPASAPLGQLTKVHIQTMSMFQLSSFFPAAPLLRDLQIDELRGSAARGVVKVPFLERLKVNLAHLDYAILMDYLCTPQLQHLDLVLQVDTQDETALGSFLFRSQCNLRRLHLRALNSEEESIVRLLRLASPLLMDLVGCTIHLMPITERIVNELMPPIDGSQIEVPFPSLDDLGLIGCRMGEDGLIGKMVSRRADVGAALSVCEIQVSGGQGQKDEQVLQSLKGSGQLRELYFSRRG